MTDPHFNPAYRTARCGQQSAHSRHVVEHGPDQPRNCPGTGAPAEDLTRLTVNLTPRGRAAVGAVEQRLKLSRTDLVNKAVQLLAIVVEQAEREGVTTVELPWDDRPLWLKISRRPFPRWRPW